MRTLHVLAVYRLGLQPLCRGRDNAAAVEESYHLIALQCLDVVSRFERCFSSYADARNEATEVRWENYELGLENDALHRENVVELRREKYELLLENKVIHLDNDVLAKRTTFSVRIPLGEE